MRVAQGALLLLVCTCLAGAHETVTLDSRNEATVKAERRAQASLAKPTVKDHDSMIKAIQDNLANSRVKAHASVSSEAKPKVKPTHTSVASEAKPKVKPTQASVASEAKPKVKPTQAKTTVKDGGDRKCKMAYHMGAILDVAEKTCEANKEVVACANSGQCSKWSELGTLVGALNPKNPEAMWKVCCFRAYKIGGYQTCKKPEAKCAAALKQHVLDHVSSTGLVKALSGLKLSSSKQEYCRRLLPKLSSLLNRLQAARGELWKSSTCTQKLANPKPYAKCGAVSASGQYAGKYHSLSRNDLYCDTIEWQYNEMGAGDSYMKKCKGAKFRTKAQQVLWSKKQNAEIKKDGVQKYANMNGPGQEWMDSFKFRAQLDEAFDN